MSIRIYAPDVGKSSVKIIMSEALVVDKYRASRFYFLVGIHPHRTDGWGILPPLG